MWQRVTREQLYEQVWAAPIWTVCKQYGLSDNGLRKACRRLNVPVPARGYWAKVEAGHKVRKTPLPEWAGPKATDIWVKPKREHTPADDADTEWLKERLAFEVDVANAIAVLEKPRRWHPAIGALEESLELDAKTIEADRKVAEQYERWPESRKRREVGPDRWAWLAYERAGHVMPTTHHASAVRLSLEQWRRGLSILNAVAVAATSRGLAVSLEPSEGRIVLQGHGGRLALRMSEKSTQTMRPVRRYDGTMESERSRVPTGRLSLHVERGYGKVWTLEESASARLEESLNAFFAGVWRQIRFCRQKAREEAAEAQRRAVLAAERAEVERRAAEEAACRAAEQARREVLVAEVSAWRQAEEIRAYVAAVRAQVERSGTEGSAEFEDWERWALGVAREMDPLVVRGRGGS